MIWNRYIDDIFLVWTQGKEELERFLKELNEAHPNLKFTREFSEEKILFLNLSLSLSNGKLYIDLHTKVILRNQ